MASNKKPRKRYTPKPVRVNAFRPEDVKDMWEMLSKIETRTLLKLQYGDCTKDELRRILNALETSTEFVRDALAVGATTFMHEFNASLLVRDAVGVAKKFTVDKRVIDFAFREAQNLDNFKYSKKYANEYSKCCARIAEQISYCSQRLQNKGIPA